MTHWRPWCPTLVPLFGGCGNAYNDCNLKRTDGHPLDESTKKKLFSDKEKELVTTVTNSAEFQRIKALPQRALDLGKVIDVTPLVRRAGGHMLLRAIQSAALIEAAETNGLFAPIAVGQGKTLITLLLPFALDSKNTVLLVPPELKRKTLREIRTIYAKHFKLPDCITIVTYNELSSAKRAGVLDLLKPDLIVADECHYLKNFAAARTKRFLRYFRDNPACRFCGLSGTVANRSVLEYSHLIELALRHTSPMPRGFYELRTWASAVDTDEPAIDPGVLREFCAPGETVREGFCRRRNETKGVVATNEAFLGVSLYVRKITVSIPPVVLQAIDEVRKSWSIGGEEFDSILTQGRILRQVAMGFYYVWDWPGGSPDVEWLQARAAWHKAVREQLKRNIAGMDSPLLLARAAERWRAWVDGESPRRPTTMWPCEEWRAWRVLRHRYDPTPPKRAVWLSNYMAEAAIQRAKVLAKTGPTIVWYNHVALGKRIAELSGLPRYGQGQDASEATDQIIVCSVPTQGTGKNLQHYSRNLITTMNPNGKTFEQLVGRTHRPGQKADDVWVEWFGHTKELEAAYEQMIEDSKFAQQTGNEPRRILYATVVE